MPRLRPRREKPSEPLMPEAALCVQEFRPAAIARLIRKGERLPLNHWAVRAHPEYFVGVVPLPPHGSK